MAAEIKTAGLSPRESTAKIDTRLGGARDSSDASEARIFTLSS
jgi:hypothetical protein